jgi:hypothetical protein
VIKEFKKLLDDLADVPVAQHREQIDAAINDARDLIEHGEEGVALENICQNLYEWDFPLSRAHYERLQQIGRHYGFENHTWSFLAKIVA